LRLRWTRLAERDLDEIAAYIGQDNPAAAARVILEPIDQVESLLPAHPAIGRPGRVLDPANWSSESCRTSFPIVCADQT
jgi:plasmid stabilization system protein ParE